MQMPVETRAYETMLELAFDLERLCKWPRIPKLFYHFHKSTYKNHTVRPYAIVVEFDKTNKHTMKYDDIVGKLHYIPTFMTKKLIKLDIAYVDIENIIREVPSTASFASQLMSYYETSLSQEAISNKSIIDPVIITNLKTILESSGIEYNEDDDYIHIQGMTSICKHDRSHNDIRSVIYPTKYAEYNDIMCIGHFVKYNGKNTSFRTDTNLALITECNSCHSPIILNYELGSICRTCHAKVSI